MLKCPQVLDKKWEVYRDYPVKNWETVEQLCNEEGEYQIDGTVYCESHAKRLGWIKEFGKPSDPMRDWGRPQQ